MPPSATDTTEARDVSTSGAEPLLAVRDITKSFGKLHVLRGISLQIEQGEFLTILGESGSGKTTLLRLIAGFEQPNSGEIWMTGERLDLLPPYRRRVNTVFQHYALFPHLSVSENVAYGLRVKKIAKAEVSARVDEALRKVRMESFSDSKPGKISGGQQQRVALARALVNRPQLLLLDEPLSALDANLRRQMQMELKSLQRQVGISFVFVTHDQEEAMVMSDRIALLRNGELEQVATPREIYSHPATSYTALFIGHTNLLQCSVVRGIAHCQGFSFPSNAADGSAIFSLRPENVRVVDGTPPRIDDVLFRARVCSRSFHGATDLLQIETAAGLKLTVRTATFDDPGGEREFTFKAGDAVPVRDSQAIGTAEQKASETL
jgi:ABC-type Fe3+/spermidine/putrescine transport system ATPase subunit